MKKKLAAAALLALSVLGARAQYDAAFTNYWALQSYYNPAASGGAEMLDIQAAYSMQMAGFEDAPGTLLAAADLPLFFINANHGAGVGFMNDAIGLFTNQKIYLQYAYHQPLGKRFKISAGVRVALLNASFDASKVDVEDSGDPAFGTSQIKGMGFDLDAGLRMDYGKDLYVGLSAMHLTSPTLSLGDEKRQEMRVKPLLYLTAGHTLRFRRPQFALHTSGILRTNLRLWRGDVSARLSYTGDKLHLYGGLTYAPTVSVGLMVGTVFHGVKIGYSYEMYTGGVGLLNGTHELVLGYQMDLNIAKKGKNLHKSVRLL